MGYRLANPGLVLGGGTLQYRLNFDNGWSTGTLALTLFRGGASTTIYVPIGGSGPNLQTNSVTVGPNVTRVIAVAYSDGSSSSSAST